eukprot:1635634-Pleurochrysis_carterae.AAC.1
MPPLMVRDKGGKQLLPLLALVLCHLVELGLERLALTHGIDAAAELAAITGPDDTLKGHMGSRRPLCSSGRVVTLLRAGQHGLNGRQFGGAGHTVRKSTGAATHSTFYCTNARKVRHKVQLEIHADGGAVGVVACGD